MELALEVDSSLLLLVVVVVVEAVVALFLTSSSSSSPSLDFSIFANIVGSWKDTLFLCLSFLFELGLPSLPLLPLLLLSTTISSPTMDIDIFGEAVLASSVDLVGLESRSTNESSSSNFYVSREGRVEGISY